MTLEPKEDKYGTLLSFIKNSYWTAAHIFMLNAGRTGKHMPGIKNVRLIAIGGTVSHGRTK